MRVAAMVSMVALALGCAGCWGSNDLKRIQDLLRGKAEPVSTLSSTDEPAYPIVDSGYQWSTGCVPGGSDGSHRIVLASFQEQTDDGGELVIRAHEFSDVACSGYVGERLETYEYFIWDDEILELDLLGVDATSETVSGPRSVGWHSYSRFQVVAQHSLSIDAIDLVAHWIPR